MLTRWAVFICLGLVLILTLWIQSSLEQETLVKPKDRGEPDSIMWDFKRTDMDEMGAPKAQLQAKLMKHYSLDDSVELEAPLMEIYTSEGLQPWHVKAETGWLSGDGEKLLLYGDVFIWRNRQPDQPLESSSTSEKAIELITTDLKILINEEYAETENFVTIINGPSRMTATGLQANLKKRNLKLLENVRGHYENHSSP